VNKTPNEFLSAFVDSELSHKENESMFQAMSEDRQLAEDACGLRTLKLMVRHAYEDTLEHKPTRPKLLDSYATKAIAATLILGLGSLAGWEVHDEISTTPSWNTASQGLPGGLQPVSLAVDPISADRVLLHIDNNDPQQIRSALDEAATLLKSGLAEKKDVHIEILANNRGLDMLRSDRSPVVFQIAQMSREYPHNLSFVACGQSIKRFTQEGQQVRLLPQVQIAPNAIAEIVDHLKNGWTYIKV
jgi:intracellular sulfur oxidation DsrE/DsrF family protein